MPSSSADLDSELMLRVQQGDEISFQRLTEIHRPTLHVHLCRRIRNPAVAEELVQDIFLRVYRARHRWHPTSAKFTTWLFRISMNVILNHFRDNRRRSRDLSMDARVSDDQVFDFPDGARSVEQDLIRLVLQDEIRKAVDSLPRKQRTAVWMHKWDNLDYHSIAVELGCSHPALKAIMFRAYETLRAQLAHLGYGERG